MAGAGPGPQVAGKGSLRAATGLLRAATSPLRAARGRDGRRTGVDGPGQRRGAGTGGARAAWGRDGRRTGGVGPGRAAQGRRRAGAAAWGRDGRRTGGMATQMGADATTTELVLKSNVELTARLPALSGAAKLTIKGACGSTGIDKCIISGRGAFPIFTSPSTINTAGQLTLVNLTFQYALGGVFSKVLTPVDASQCNFAHNIAAADAGGGVLRDNITIMPVPPKRLFTRCIFYNNSSPALGGGAVNIDAHTFNATGLTDRVPALTFLRCRFMDNSAPNHLGKAVRVAGTARLRFEECVFDGNSADECVSGGAIYAKDAAFTFVRATLNYNKALGTSTLNSITSGEGGAAYAAASGRNSEAAVRFCSSTFQANTAKFTDGSTLYMETGWGSSWAAVLSICDGSKPTGTVVPTTGWKLVTGCPASTSCGTLLCSLPTLNLSLMLPPTFPLHDLCSYGSPHGLPSTSPSAALLLPMPLPSRLSPPFPLSKQHL
ncbi:unnamed protein product [Closterium sp. NIES-65]|nr:unnamed protein product [Closterium sp. NIES-65]